VVWSSNDRGSNARVNWRPLSRGGREIQGKTGGSTADCRPRGWGLPVASLRETPNHRPRWGRRETSTELGTAYREARAVTGAAHVKRCPIAPAFRDAKGSLLGTRRRALHGGGRYHSINLEFIAVIMGTSSALVAPGYAP